MLRQCLYCTTSFEADQREVNRGNARYCSRSCGARARKSIVHLPNCSCATCGKTFYRTPSKMKGSKSGLYFCNRICKESMQRLENGKSPIQPPHYGNGNGTQYRAIALSSKPNECEVCGYNVREILQVHHKDHDRSNNSLANLEILCPTHHMEHHFRTKTGYWAKST